jgi:hypothetical protein
MTKLDMYMDKMDAYQITGIEEILPSQIKQYEIIRGVAIEYGKK